MANVDQLRGFWPIGHLLGGEIRTKTFIVTTGATCYQGDLLKVVAAGTVEPSVADDGVIVIGVAAEYVTDSGSAGGKEIQVYADPYIEFGIQSDSGTATTALTVFATANHVATTGNTTTLQSKHELDSSDITTGGQLEILGLVDMPDNDWGEHSKLRVRIAEHKWNAAVAGV
jgi:hypothetical protein